MIDKKQENLNAWLQNRGKQKTDLMSKNDTDDKKYDNMREWYQTKYVPRKAQSYFSGINDFSKEYNNYLKSAENSYQSPDTLKSWEDRRESAYNNNNKNYANALSYLNLSGDYKNTLNSYNSAYESAKKAGQNLSDFYSQFDTEDTYNSWKKTQDLLNYDIKEGENRLRAIEDKYGYTSTSERLKELQDLGYSNEKIKDEVRQLEKEGQIIQDRINNDEEYNRIRSEIEEARPTQEFSYKYKTDPQFAAKYDNYVASQKNFEDWYNNQNGLVKSGSQAWNVLQSFLTNVGDSFNGVLENITNATNNILYGTDQAPEGTINAALQKYYDFSHNSKADQDMMNEFYRQGLRADLGNEFAADLILDTANVIPDTLASAAIAYATGGTSLAAKGAGTLLNTVGKGTTSNALYNAFKNLAKNPNLYYSFIREGGSAYNEAKASGASELEASVAMFATGLPNALIEIGGGVEKLPDVKDAKGINQWLKQIVGTGTDEAKEEVLQGINEQLMAKLTYAPEKELFTVGGDGIIDPVRMIQEAYGGFVGGSIGGAGGAVVNRLKLRNYEKSRTDYMSERMLSEFDALKEYAAGLDDNNEFKKLYNSIAQAKSNDQKISKDDYVKLYEAKAKDNIRRADIDYTDGLKRYGSTDESIQKVLPIIDKMRNGDEITKADGQALLDNNVIHKFMSEYFGDEVSLPTIMGWANGNIIPDDMVKNYRLSVPQRGLTYAKTVNQIVRNVETFDVHDKESVLPILEKMQEGKAINEQEANTLLDNTEIADMLSSAIGAQIDTDKLINFSSGSIAPQNSLINISDERSLIDVLDSFFIQDREAAKEMYSEKQINQGRKLLGLMEEQERYDLKGTPLPSVTVNGESANITGIDSKTDDGLFVSLDNGSKVNIKDIDFGENSVAEALYNIAAESNLDPKAAKEFIDNYNGSSTIGQYAGMYGAIYNLAKTGAPFEQAQRSYDAAIKYGFISPKAANSAYQSGYISGEASRAAYRQQTEKLRSSQAAYKAEVKDNSGGKATKEQKKLAAVISKTTGYTVELVSGTIDSGIADTQALGSIDTSNAVITLDVSKGNYAATTLHEVTHFIAVNAPEQFARFKNEVIRFEINEGRLASDLNKYAKMYSNIDNINDLTEEMAANAAEALLKSDDFIVNLMSDKKFVQSMAQESPSIAKKIFNKLQEIIDAIRDFLKHSDVEHDIARAISKDAQTLESIKDLWLDAFKTAIHNRAVQHDNTNSSEESTDNKSSGKKFSITENMTEEERYNELKDKTISPAHPDMSKVADIDVESYRTLSTKNAKKPIRQLAHMLGIHNVNYSNSSIDFEFGFSSNSLKTSLNHQQEYGGVYSDYAKMLTCLDELVNNAELIEVHKDYKGNEYLQNTYVLLSAYTEDGYLYPVQLEVKQYKEGQSNGLYLSVILTKIKEPAVVKEEHKEISTLLVTGSNINISQLFANVNTSDAKFLKYVPDQFLTDKQIDAKRQAQKIDYEKYGRYKELFEPSARFSIPEQTDGEYETLLHENEQLHEQVKALRAEMKLTRGHKVRPDAVAKLARRLKKEYSSNIDVDDLAKRLEDVFNYVASDDAIANIAHEVMYAIAGDIINNSQQLNTEMRDDYNEIRDMIRRTTIFVSGSMKAEIEYLYGDYNAFRKSMFGKMKLSTKTGIDKKGINVDSFYQDLMSAAPEWFDEIPEQEILPRIADFLNATDPYMENPYEQDTEQYISDLAQEIFNQYFETPEIKTFADKQQQKLQKVINASRKQIAKLREQNKEQFDKRLAKLKEANAAKIDSLKVKNAEKLLAQKAKYQDMAKRKSERLRENAEVKKHRESIKKNAKEILRWFDNPDDKKHVPELLRNTVAEFLNSIDFISDAQEKNAAKGEPSKEYNFWQAAAERLYRVISEETKVTEEKESGGTAYNFSDFAVELDPDFLSRLNEIIESSKLYKRISDMDSASLKELDTLILSLRHAITSVNKLYTNRITESVAELANMTNEELYSRELKKAHNAIMSKVDKVLNVSMLIPMDFFERMGKGGESIYNSLKNANNEFVRLIDAAQKYTQYLLKDFDVKGWLNSEAYEFDINGDKIKLDVVHIMELYVLWQREQAKLHIIQGGIIPTDIGKGKHAIHSVDPVRIPETKLVEIFQKLTPEQIKVAEAMQEFLSTTVSDWGNEISLQRYGYKKFTEKNYWPIKSSDNQIPANDSNTTNTGLFRINNLGMTKSTVKNANNAIAIDDIFKSFSDHIVEMALYASYGPALSDTMKWYNYKDKSGDITKSVKGGIERIYGNEAKSYFVKLMQDLNNVKDGYNLEAGLLNSMVGKTKAAAVAGNIRVALQQPTSIVRASAVMNPKYITKGAAEMYRHPKKTTNEVRKYAPIAVWKSWGYYDTNIGRNLQQVITGQQSVKDKIVEKTMLLAQYGDTLTMGSLWEACKLEIADTRADLKVGSDEFFEAAHERYDYIIDRTQVVDSVLQRSQAMRNKDGLIKMATSFMAESTKTFGLMRRAIADYAVKNTKQNAEKLVRTSFATVLTAAFTAAAAALSDAFRDDDKAKKWSEKYIENFFKNLIDNVNPLNMIPYVKDVVNALQGYEPERTDVSAAVGAVQLIQNVIDKVQSGKADELNPFNLFYNASRYVSQFTGIPIYSILREADAAIDIFADPIFRKSKTKNSDIYVNMYRAALNGDQKGYEDNYNKLLSDGKTDKEIETSLRSIILDAESEIYDNRVYEAAQHRINGNTSGYIVILDELISESGLSQDFWVKAINSEINRINSEGQEQSEYRQMLIDSGMSVQLVEQMDAEQLKETSENISIDTGDPSSLTAGANLSLYNAVDLTAAITKRSEKDFQEIYRDIISAKTLQYMLQNNDISETDAEKKAVSAVKSSITSNIKPIIKELYSTDKEEFKKLRKFLSAYAGYDSATINKWTIE